MSATTPDPAGVSEFTVVAVARARHKHLDDYGPLVRDDALAQAKRDIEAVLPHLSGLAEVSEAAVEAAARAIYAEEENYSMDSDAWPEYDSEENVGRAVFEESARAAIIAALPHLSGPAVTDAVLESAEKMLAEPGVQWISAEARAICEELVKIARTPSTTEGER